MGLSLMALAPPLPSSTASLAVVPAIAALGTGIGQCWPFIAHRIMNSAKARTRSLQPRRSPPSSRSALPSALRSQVCCKCQWSLRCDSGSKHDALRLLGAGSFAVPAILAFLTELRLRPLRKP